MASRTRPRDGRFLPRTAALQFALLPGLLALEPELLADPAQALGLIVRRGVRGLRGGCGRQRCGGPRGGGGRGSPGAGIRTGSTGRS
jgi:hypothetical protein